MSDNFCSFEPSSNLTMVGEMLNKCSDTCTCTYDARVTSPQCTSSSTCLQCTDEQPPPDHSLETWMHELQERNIIARRIMERTGKSACQVLFNRASTVDQRDKSMVQRILDHAERMRPVNRHLAKGFVLLECIDGRRVPHLLETVPRRQLHMEISGLPGLTKGEMLGKNWCCRRSAWISSKVVQEGIRRHEQDIKRVVPFFPDIEHLHVIGTAMPIHYPASAPEDDPSVHEIPHHFPTSEDESQQSCSDYTTMSHEFPGAYCIIPKNTTLLRMDLMVQDSAEHSSEPSSGNGVRVSEPISDSVKSNKESTHTIQTPCVSICDCAENLTECRCGNSENSENTFTSTPNSAENLTECRCGNSENTFTTPPYSDENLTECRCGNSGNPFTTPPYSDENLTECRCGNTENTFTTPPYSAENLTECRCGNSKNTFTTPPYSAENLTECRCGNSKNSENTFTSTPNSAENLTECRCGNTENSENTFTSTPNSAENLTECRCGNSENTFTTPPYSDENLTECRCGNSGNPFTTPPYSDENLTECRCGNSKNTFTTPPYSAENLTECRCGNTENTFTTPPYSDENLTECRCGNCGNPVALIRQSNSELLPGENNLSPNVGARTKQVTINAPNLF